MSKTVIYLSEHRSPRDQNTHTTSAAQAQPSSSPDAARRDELTAASGILSCLRSLLEEAESAGLPLAAAGLRVAIDAVRREAAEL